MYMLAVKCPYCRDDLHRSDECVRCVICGAPHHGSCWGQNGGCAVYGCLTQRQVLALKPRAETSLGELTTDVISWSVMVLGFAFMLFLPVTMFSMIVLSAHDFRGWILTQGYLESFLLVASVVTAGCMRQFLVNRKDFTGFVTAFILMSLILWYAGIIWTDAHLPN